MTLRTRLLIGYGYLVVLVVITAVSAASGFFGLSQGIDRILEENFASVEASTEMLEALERQDSAMFEMLLGQKRGSDTLVEADAEFFKALDAARSNVTVEQEGALVRQIEADFQRYQAARDELISEHPDKPLAQYNDAVFPLFVDVKEDVLALLDVNHDAMVEADREARSTATRNGVWLGVLVTVGLLSFVFLTRALQKHLLARLAEFEEVTEAIAAGDEYRRLPAERDDELGVIARHFNAAVDRLDQMRSQSSGRLSEYKGLVIGLMAEVPDEAVLLGLDGAVISSMLSEANETLLRRHLDEIADLSKECYRKSDADFFEYDLGDAACQFELVKSKERRPVGWLGRIVEREGAEEEQAGAQEDSEA